MDQGTVGVIIVGAVIAVVVLASKRKQRGAAPVILVGRPVAPPSNVLKNIFVIAIVVGLGWFFYYVMITRCHGGC